MFSKDKDVDSVLNAIFAEVPPIDTSKLRRDQSMRLISLQELSIILDGALCAAAGSGFVSTVGRELRDFAPVASVEWDVFMMRQLKAILTMVYVFGLFPSLLDVESMALGCHADTAHNSTCHAIA